MTHQLLLISRDPEMALRLRRALPEVLALELHSAPAYRPSSDPRGWLLILADAQAAAPPPVEAEDAPILWLGAGGGAEHLPPVHIRDYVERTLTPSKLAFILHQHLTAAYLKRMRRLSEEPPANAGWGRLELEGQLNNLLAGILGNAELARQSGRRLSPPLSRRLERICDLAGEMRGLLLVLRTSGAEAVRGPTDVAA